MANVSSTFQNICKRLGIPDELTFPYGRDMGKIDVFFRGGKQGKLVLVTAVTPTTQGEGKTTSSIGIAQGLQKLGINVSVCLREPSMGPVFGMKGGATGGGKSKVEPSDKINLMFTGDFPSISAAHNLLSAAINNHIHFGNKLRVNSSELLFPRTIDMNDRSLRNIIVGVGDGKNGAMTMDKFLITPASEIMAIMGLSVDYVDLTKRLGDIVIGYNYERNPVLCRDLAVNGAMAAILVDALKPNLVQTTEGVPAFVHTGPFANIAHGTCSLLSMKMALSLSDYVIVEAGFGSDLGAEKFMNIVSRLGEIPVDHVVLICTIKALKEIGKYYDQPLNEGFKNILKHVNNIRNFGRDPIVCINRFSTDSIEDLNALKRKLTDSNIKWALSEAFEKGGDGSLDMAKLILNNSSEREPINYTYEIEDDPIEKIRKVAQKVYGCTEVIFTNKARKDLKQIHLMELNNLPICIAKSQYTFSGSKDPKSITIKEVIVDRGAGFLVPISGDIMTMPGLPEKPSYLNMHVDQKGDIYGVL